MNFLRSPLVHFLLFGGLIFVLQIWRLQVDPEREAEADPDALVISIDSEKIDELRTTYHRQMGRAPSARELEVMVATEVDEEILYREALALGFIEEDGAIQTRLIQKMLFLESEANLEDARDLLARALSLGLHRDDIVVRRILVQKMRLHGSRLAPEEKPSDEEVAQTYHDRRESLREPDRRDLIHVFLSADQRRNHTVDDARVLRTRILEAKISATEAIALGDPFPLGHRLEARSELDLRRSFGTDFGRHVFADPIETWSFPIASAYGQHLVWTSQFRPGTIPPFEAVAGRIRGELERDERKRKLEVMLQRERIRYTIAIESAGEQE
jgi:peptidyl-prolyl cis-trans isomerase C